MEYSISANASAKINLFLHVNGKNNDDFHDLESLVVFATDIYDIIKISQSDDIILNISGPFAKELNSSDNILLKAVDFFKGQRKLGVKIDLEKNIPISSGIGGGSSDAAAIIKLLSRLWNIDIDEELISNLKSIGSDVPCCYFGKAAYFSGIGDVIDNIEILPKLYILLVNPNIEISTKEIFSMMKQPYSEKILKKPKFFNNSIELIDFLIQKKNDLQNIAINIAPEIEKVLDLVKIQNNCLLSRMSGSGSTCFGLFDNLEDVVDAYNNIKNQSDYWVMYSMIN